MYRTVHRRSGRAAVGGLVLALGVVGAATVPTASGSHPVRGRRAEGHQGHDRHPARHRDAAPPGRPGQPRSVLRRAARRLPHHDHRVGRLPHQRLPDQGRLRRHEGRLRRLAVRRPARRRGTARRVRPPGRQGRAAGRRARAADEGRRACPHRSGRRRGPGTPTGARHRQRPAARPGHPGVLRQPGQRRQHRGPVGAGLLRRRQQRLRLLPGQQLREVRARARGRERRRGQQRGGRLAAAPLRPPELRQRLRRLGDQARRRRRHGRRPVRRLRVLRHQQGRLAQRLRAARHGDRGGLRDVVRRRGQRLRQQRVGPPGRPARLGAQARRHRREPLRRHHVRRVDVHAQQRARPEVDDRGHGPRDGSRHRLPRPLRHRPHQRGRVQVERDVDRQLEPGRYGLLRDHARRDGRVLEVLPGLAGADPRRRGHQRRPAAVLGDQPHGLPAGGEPRRRGLEVRGAQGRGRVLPRREPAAGRLGRRPPRLRRDRLPRRRGRHVQQQGQRRREPPAGRRRRGRRQPGHEHLRLSRLGRGRVPRLQRPRRLHGRDEPGGDAVLRRSRRVRRCTSTAVVPTR